ncbi:patatin-like phospholipase family protein [Bradyrhizobium cenepequi]|uniref:patatin-like phospholipase family protein n=1 Tax=Bradyrhizobium cenepequi TaxID=2821403 RepID=UPI001CE30F0F|nr:patatin-like phospholipase family protein [Bradyrhizobium cenepequi]MCA6109717.1 patatin-like phospholipase family protein [Bradyrhizobium cenepequi]
MDEIEQDRLGVTNTHDVASRRVSASSASALLAASEIWSFSDDTPSADSSADKSSAEAERLAAPPPQDAVLNMQSARADLPARSPSRKPKTADAGGPPVWPPRQLSLALQGGGTFAAFTWGALERLLEEPDCAFDTISGASAGAVNAALLACGLVEGGREGARAALNRFWMRIMHEASFRSLMLVGGFSPAGHSVAFGPTLRSGQFDPFDLDPLRQALARDIDFTALQSPACPKLLVAATRVRDGRQQVFGNAEITADTLLASTCPPLIHCAVEIDGESYWDGGFGTNPPLVRLVQESETSNVLVVQVTPARDSYIPITPAAIDRRLDQITANSVLNAEIAALEWARPTAAPSLRLFRMAAEDEIDGLAQRSATDLGPGFIRLLHRSGRKAAERFLAQDAGSTRIEAARRAGQPVAAQVSAEAALL